MHAIDCGTDFMCCLMLMLVVRAVGAACAVYLAHAVGSNPTPHRLTQRKHGEVSFCLVMLLSPCATFLWLLHCSLPVQQSFVTCFG